MDRIKIVIVGLQYGGCIAEELMQNDLSDMFDLTGVCDLDQNKASMQANFLGVRQYYELDDVLADGSVNAIGLFTPPAGRAALIERIISSGKHVMTTKPFELDPAAAIAVLDKAAKLGMVVHMNSPSPVLTQDMQKLVDWRNIYNLGLPIACRADVWGYYREQYTGTWYDDPVRCPVAPVFRIGIYLINDLVRLFGQAEEVQVLHSRIFTGRPTPDNAILGIKFRNGALATIFASFCVQDGQYYKNSLTLNYESGTVYRNTGFLPFRSNYSASDLMLVTLDGQGASIVKEEHINACSGLYQWDVFYRAIFGEEILNQITPDEVAEGIRIINAMARAELSGRTEKI